MPESKRGLLLVISGPSGVGKSTIAHAVEKRLDAVFSVSMTTRPQAASDVEGVDYYVLSDVDGNGAAGDVDLLANEYPTLVTGDIVWT